MKKKAEQPKHSDAEMKRYLGSLAEHFDHRFDAVIEQFSGINRKLDAQREVVGELKEDSDISKVNMEIVKSGLAKKVDYQEFLALEKRVRLVETKLRH
ncbi:MAG: hypothetical protein A3C93_03015 [Candidatus Lloydbacteria bacterium RIFCSPHIGHO2_02_FULL_54_17]|uniref:Uncharacterized protein n=1 Tax=Candidatus Lloydbacteria bacterium RIFCSPHIGHO2_02_FULL_54_17 TaxID=1798664 RepID=A0A1G2DAI1_9BACT|nr:MAG: hypothetical protein A2762_04885 [Candidatus Lloydbacteria bacterium RIFCSPHIGHO2_01_FULL_54_11]OGZ10639.1 MAG: hypothetical protein A3C93_03015 [Candidatus Lloydbacteria bacterium RIFCSPHIGHO2_02_FULL_54_17]OGZ13674.1 MAG: hypothetical protein A2948_03205 [Candidatus Lloydbacteria bacterium RIFCSPLOWO2_01_FULL_54_18]OGZ16108.1 MAG: hypothetical protein A3H76_01660 [Candidatus Lloydbacteria bacterium RIFCSPLOWO2_02_FULL_54_12]